MLVHAFAVKKSLQLGLLAGKRPPKLSTCSHHRPFHATWARATSESTDQHPSSTSAEPASEPTGTPFLSFAYKLRGQLPPSTRSPGPRTEAQKEERRREREANAKARGLLPLPPLPDAPNYPCPYLTKEEIVQYLSPLYQQGWFIGSSEFTADKRLPRGDDVARSSGVGFAESVGSVQTAEDHHCTMLVDDESIHIRTHTHSARPLPTTRDAKPSKSPGITLRDVRLAILIEQKFQDHLRRDAAPWRSQFMNARDSVRPLMPQGIERLRRLAEFRGTLACPVCKGPHKGVQCPKKDVVQPATPCSRCGKMHWRFMCDAVAPTVKQ
ncbi:uncharacterized protein B0H18DRAFT_995014 [Fomitopsis serialis]|uniref:uncharacterized protein n=1 Tax=Fomitopsis serialis TaxID=139415 RepID=UPI0020077DCB|nr:uncharacterized protein B0H18DRAFT_995014 [Neoantrodia serialis]KAH9930054.1 hypothetical protein B0H18DRAFT_995014 [Neoantrodia serialis]